MDRYWKHWRLSQTMWNLVRPLVHIYNGFNEHAGFTFNVSGCYDDVDLGLYIFDKEEELWDKVFEDMNFALVEFEQSVKKDLLQTIKERVTEEVQNNVEV